MKKLFLTIILFFFIGFPGNTNAQLINPLFSSTVTAKGVVVSISVNGPINSTVIPVISEQPITTISSIQETPGFGQKTINVMGVPAYWQGQLKPDTNYEVRIVQITGLRSQDKKFVTDSIKIKTEKAGEIFYNKLGKSDFEKTGTNQYRLKGSIDATKHKSTDLVPLSTIQVSGLFYDLKSKETILTLPNITPNQDGSYEFDIKSNGIFNENTTYGLRIVFSSTTGASATYEVKGVNTSKGYIIPETGKEAEDFLNKNSYRLLAPIPGMTMLLDPELCKLEQQKDPGQICDINAFLNFLLQLAIGAAAVILVVRIIISGYGYMLTDVPYIKVKLKGQFIEAMIGLVVALSSYLILNTVNPKLVSNNINIGVASFEIEETLAISSAGYDSNSVKNLSLEEIKKIKTQYGKNWEGSIKGVYIPARDLAVPSISNGIKTLMTAQASYEGFIIPGENSQYPNGSKSFRSNNPGNLGTDWTRTGTFPTLDAGIKAQYNYINRVIKGEHKAYPLGKRLAQPATTLAGHSYPAIDFNPYTGTLRQYLNIYDAGTRLNNSYLTFIISFFQKSGYTITPETTLSQIAQLN